MDLLNLLDLTTERGNPLYPHEGKLYYVKSTAGNRDYMRCHTCKVGCAIRDRITGQIELQPTGCAYNCVLDLSFYAKKEFIKVGAQRFAELSSRTKEDAFKMANDFMLNKYGNAVDFVVPMTHCKTPFYEARLATMPPIPHRYCDVPASHNFPHRYAFIEGVTGDAPEQQFLYVNQDIVDEDGHTVPILAFTTTYDLIQAGNAECLALDGTFKTCPAPFSQIFTINSFIGTGDKMRLFPRVYFLLPNKSQFIYEAVFELLLQMIEAAKNGDPALFTMVNCDYESGILAALRSERLDPNHILNLNGCDYHFDANVFKHATSGNSNMSEEYDNMPEMQRFLRYLYALAYVPEQEVQQAFYDIVAQRMPPNMGNDPRMIRFLNYFETTWILNDEMRRAFNCYNRASRYKTNNDIEGWHYKLLHKMDTHHLNLWSFLERLQELHHQSQVEERLMLSQPEAARIRAKKVREKEANLQRMVEMKRQNQYPTNMQYLSDVKNLMAVLK